MTYADEAIGIVRAAARGRDARSVISFTVETDGRLPSGQPLGEAIEQVDAATDGRPRTSWSTARIPPTSRTCSSETAPGSTGSAASGPTRRRRATPSSTRPSELDAGDPDELAAEYRALRRGCRSLTVVGGCCGTDDRHIAAIGDALRA